MLYVCVTRSNSCRISHISCNSVRTTYRWRPLQFRLHNLSLSIRCPFRLSIYCFMAEQRCFIVQQCHRGVKQLPCNDAPTSSAKLKHNERLPISDRNPRIRNSNVSQQQMCMATYSTQSCQFQVSAALLPRKRPQYSLNRK